jgi:hypothetical protein
MQLGLLVISVHLEASKPDTSLALQPQTSNLTTPLPHVFSLSDLSVSSHDALIPTQIHKRVPNYALGAPTSRPVSQSVLVG